MIEFPLNPKDLIGKKLRWEQEGSDSNNDVFLITSFISDNEGHYNFQANNLTRNEFRTTIEVGFTSKYHWVEVTPAKPPIVSVNRLELIMKD